MFRRFLYFIVSSILICNVTFASPLPELSADGAFLIETNTNTILYSKNGYLTFYPASTTKVLTALAIASDLPMTQIITKSQESVNEVPSDSSQIGIEVGTQYTVYDGLHAVLMASDNFVCHDLALADSGSISAFASHMNTLAAKAGAKDYNFVNPHGYHDSNHYVTPASLARITKAAFDNPIVSEIAGTLTYNFTAINTGKVIPLKHTSALLNPDSPYYNEHVVATKTGYHTPAGRTLVAKATYGDMDFIGVVMRTDAPLQFQDMNKLFDYASTNFSLGTDKNEISYLTNLTYSNWAKPYIEEALDKGWITNSSHNYTTAITKREFLTLLHGATLGTYNEPIDKMIHYTTPSIDTENLPITRAELASSIYRFFKQFKLTALPTADKISDIGSLSTFVQEAISFCIQSGILSLRDENTFLPNEQVTYEEGICIISKINDVLARYENFSL
ncbi:MAG: S-layer homology domain-containing protein [Cellulosilyticum sp.]|nr:S-layer homology domain-containing protein [Cellulosilyticum sp.]